MVQDKATAALEEIVSCTMSQFASYQALAEHMRSIAIDALEDE